jgi:hypothetical protein
LTPTSLEVFDFAEQGMVTGQRDATTVATQALYLLNDPFVRRQSLNLAQRVLAQPKMDDAGKIDLAYQLTLGRAATSEEVERATKFIAAFEAADRQTLAANAAPVLVASAKIEATPDTGGNSTKAEDGQAAADPDKSAAAGDKKKPEVNPDEVIHVEAPPKEDSVKPGSPREAAWANFCQALLGSAEFRYLK